MTLQTVNAILAYKRQGLGGLGLAWAERHEYGIDSDGIADHSPRLLTLFYTACV